jgi:hypothetical protein
MSWLYRSERHSSCLRWLPLQYSPRQTKGKMKTTVLSKMLQSWNKILVNHESQSETLNLFLVALWRDTCRVLQALTIASATRRSCFHAPDCTWERVTAENLRRARPSATSQRPWEPLIARSSGCWQLKLRSGPARTSGSDSGLLKLSRSNLCELRVLPNDTVFIYLWVHLPFG